MKKNKSVIPNRQSEAFDIMLSQQDYQRTLQAKNLYESTLQANKVLQSELEKYKSNFHTFKKQGEQLVKKVMKLSKRIIILEEQKQQMIKQKSLLLAQNKKLLQSFKQFKSSKETQNELRKQVQKLTTQLNEQNNKYTEIQFQKNNIQEQNEKFKKQIDKLIATNSQMQTFSQRIAGKIMNIMVILSLNQTLQGQNGGQIMSVEQKNFIKIASKPEQQCQDINIMNKKTSFPFIEQSLNRLMDKVNQLNTLQTHLTQLKHQTTHLSTSNQSLNKRLLVYENRCHNLQTQMTSQPNIQKVIAHKYQGIKQALGNNEDIARAMEELIRTYHQAIDSEYAKILGRMFWQEQE